MNLAEPPKQLIERYRAIPDAQARFAAVVDAATARPMLGDEFRIGTFRVEGCQVRTWLVPEYHEGRCWFRVDSDAISLKAIGGLLCDFYSGKTPDVVVREAPDVLTELGLMPHLAENRRRTLWRIREKIGAFAQSLLNDGP